MAKAKYYARKKKDGTVFYVDESGRNVDAATAKTNLVETVDLTESTGRGRPSIERECHRLSDENRALKEKLKESGSASAANATITRKTKLKEAFMRHGMTEAEAIIAAAGRR